MARISQNAKLPFIQATQGFDAQISRPDLSASFVNAAQIERVSSALPVAGARLRFVEPESFEM